VSHAHYASSNRRHWLHDVYRATPSFSDRLRISIGGHPSGLVSIGDTLRAAEGWFEGADVVVRFEDLIGSAGGGDDRRQRTTIAGLYAALGLDADDALVTSVQHRLGGHVPAFKKESESNERVEAIVDTAIGPVKIILIAGTVARRIVPYIKEGQTLVKGQRIALIRFGSRCDLYIPEGRVRWTAQVGDKVLAGASSLGELT